MASAPVSTHRMPDGRHAVVDGDGNVLGLHNSPFSAARQLHDYYGPVASSEEAGETTPDDETAEGEAAPVAGDSSAAAALHGTAAALKKPNIPRPGKKRPAIARPKIKRP